MRRIRLFIAIALLALVIAIVVSALTMGGAIGAKIFGENARSSCLADGGSEAECAEEAGFIGGFFFGGTIMSFIGILLALAVPVALLILFVRTFRRSS